MMEILGLEWMPKVCSLPIASYGGEPDTSY